ncbi:cytochrome c oxidase accessory protein FixG [Natronocella acetinitrilica]|uniref:Cytochrome c oxidase accessory protein FixG n=1 Tax=Natronocella acetinitrilica TaxID=414046 RepID=A0AAE3G2M2_9GAMM|nr:cytochrome c oxidase accessory protein CcoG [Natronocella acetinitrilica]MCP1674656.1 cytochrome c oxidase accessory protein FixG [Natronocella acetinitrilica]
MSEEQVHSEDAGMYVAREKIHPREVKGIFQNLRNLAVVVLLGIFYGLPWLRWDGRQAVLFDLPARQFHIFGLTFWPQDFVYLALLLIIAALSLFFFTALAGRLWCGYACPQTVWTEAFIWMERWTEGNRQQRLKLDKAPWNRRKILRRGSKHVLWVVFALFTGFTFVGYFTPITELSGAVATLSLGPWQTFWLLFYGFATWGNAGFLREQVCIYMCPYARFQSAMFDKNTLIISYDETRGEPRGGRSRSVDPREKGLGDCIDCNLCVQACPTGIDIRKGLQYECIACAACIDACDTVMDQMSYPRGLIRYSTENAMEGKPARVLRPRVLIYGVLLLALIGGVLFSLTQRMPLTVEVLADRNVVYREVDWDTIENVYTVRILNKDRVAHEYRLTVEGIPGIEAVTRSEPIRVGPGDTDSAVVRVQVPRDAVSGAGNPFRLIMESTDNPDIRTVNTARFNGPAEGRP